MDRLFLDANILFSAAYRHSSGLLAQRRLKDVKLCSSRYALEEARINLSDEAQRRRLVNLPQRCICLMRRMKSFRKASVCRSRTSLLSWQPWQLERLIY